MFRLRAILYCPFVTKTLWSLRSPVQGSELCSSLIVYMINAIMTKIISTMIKSNILNDVLPKGYIILSNWDKAIVIFLDSLPKGVGYAQIP